MLDILIQGGRVVDPYNGVDKVCDIAVKNGRIVSAGEKAAAQVIDAAGCIVTPSMP